MVNSPLTEAEKKKAMKKLLKKLRIPNANTKTLKALLETSKADPFSKMRIGAKNNGGKTYRAARVPNSAILSFLTGTPKPNASKKNGPKAAPNYNTLSKTYKHVVSKMKSKKAAKTAKNKNFLDFLKEAGEVEAK